MKQGQARNACIQQGTRLHAETRKRSEQRRTSHEIRIGAALIAQLHGAPAQLLRARRPAVQGPGQV